MRPRGPFPVLVIFGEQGSGKSSLARTLRALIDPNAAGLRRPPREERDIPITANNSHLVALDNLSRLPEWLSDALCSLATGAGFATRQLYTDDEEALFQAQRPIILNGVEEFASRPDLIDRSVILQLPKIDDLRRQPEEELDAAFASALPLILGALLDTMVAGLAQLDTIQLSEPPRMADFTKWGCAIAHACGWTPEDFTRAYTENRKLAVEASIEDSVIAGKIIEFMEARGSSWEGTSTQLLTVLNDRLAPDEMKNRRDWPKAPSVLSGLLQRCAPNLRHRGINYTLERTARKRIITLSFINNEEVF